LDQVVHVKWKIRVVSNLLAEQGSEL
jgi:hypothetical protein